MKFKSTPQRINMLSKEKVQRSGGKLASGMLQEKGTGECGGSRGFKIGR